MLAEIKTEAARHCTVALFTEPFACNPLYLFPPCSLLPLSLHLSLHLPLPAVFPSLIVLSLLLPLMHIRCHIPLTLPSSLFLHSS